VTPEEVSRWECWNIDKNDFIGTSDDDNAQVSPFKMQSVAGRQHGLSFMMKIDESEMACPALEGMGATVIRSDLKGILYMAA
jgi:hypothetical protein